MLVTPTATSPGHRSFQKHLEASGCYRVCEHVPHYSTCLMI
jgi:hypothetical protein